MNSAGGTHFRRNLLIYYGDIFRSAYTCRTLRIRTLLQHHFQEGRKVPGN